MISSSAVKISASGLLSRASSSVSTAESTARRWVEGYLTAWRSNEPEDIRALFTPDAEYLNEPWTAPLRGHDAIVEDWLKRRDEPDSFTFTWDVTAIDGATAFIQAETAYASGPTYSNLWVIRLEDDGRAASFTEWWMDQSDPS